MMFTAEIQLAEPDNLRGTVKLEGNVAQFRQAAAEIKQLEFSKRYSLRALLDALEKAIGDAEAHFYGSGREPDE